MENKQKYLTPLALAIAMVIGVYIGLYFGGNNYSNQFGFAMPSNKTTGGKLSQIINYIENEYVDTIQREKLVESAISKLLAELDPHSYYIPASEFAAATEPLEGNFEGIGVEFIVQNDTVTVVNTVVGGPSEAVGIMAGDRIIKVNGALIAGKKIENQEVMKKLRGAGGSKVKVSIVRKSENKPLEFTITRGKIPLQSIETAMMLNDTTAYIKISRFAKTTYDEFDAAVNKLQNNGKNFKNLVLDLRGNGGGYLNTAIEITEEFLPKGKLIVYTKGKSQPQRNYYSSKNGRLKDVKLAVLINEASASASEILAGALQDNDRGTIIGRRSFGKGLVQEQMDLPDQSALRLTVARYYTPTGRSIQKPYGAGIDYENEFSERIAHGEWAFEDSVRVIDSLKFKTPKGKIVYGGGGIAPDVFVPVDSSDFSMLVSSLVYTGIINQFAFDYSDLNRSKLKSFASPQDFNAKFNVDEKTFNALLGEGLENAGRVKRLVSKEDANEIKLRLKALIARNIWGNKGFYTVMLPFDKAVKKSLEK